VSSPKLARLLAEIDEQPDVVARLLEHSARPVRDVARTIRERAPSTIVLVAGAVPTTRPSTGTCEVCNRG